MEGLGPRPGLSLGTVTIKGGTTMEIKVIAEGCFRMLPSGAKQEFPVNWTGDLDEGTALRFIGEGRAEAIGGEAALTPNHIEFLRAFADASMAHIAGQSGGDDADGDDTAGGGEPDPNAPEPGDDVAPAVAPTGLPPEINLNDAAEDTPPPATPAPVKGKGKGGR
jgi:hypothetical protein